jgi:uncharacterized protein YndB with AHSA1/START domain
MIVERSIDIEAEPRRVWALVSEPEQVLAWYLPLLRFEYTSEQRGTGAPLLFEQKTPMGTAQFHCVVTDWIENERFSFRMTSGNMMKSYEERWTLEATPAGTRFTFREEGDLDLGFLGKLIQPIAQRNSKVTVDKMLARLKGLAES